MYVWYPNAMIDNSCNNSNHNAINHISYDSTNNANNTRGRSVVARPVAGSE